MLAKSRRQEILPLLQEFVSLENLEVAGKAYDAVGDMRPSNGLALEQGLRNAMAVREIPRGMALNQLINWAFLKETPATLRAEPLSDNPNRGLRSAIYLEHKSCDSSRISPGSDYLVKTCSAKYDVSSAKIIITN